MDTSKSRESGTLGQFLWTDGGRGAMFFDGVDIMKWTQSSGCMTNEGNASQKKVVPGSGGGEYTTYPNHAEWEVIYGGESYRGKVTDLWMLFPAPEGNGARSSHDWYTSQYTCPPYCPQVPFDPDHPVPLYPAVRKPLPGCQR